MLGHRLIYAAALCCCLLFYAAYGEWLSAILLGAVLGIPWLGLLLSLPALLTFRLRLHCPRSVSLGEEAEAWLEGGCRFPMPPFRGTLRLQHLGTGEIRQFPARLTLPTGHCGAFRVRAEGPRLCDYLGLFSLPVRCREEGLVLVRPKPLPVGPLPDLRRYLARGWRPKAGGGFSEHHELRPYRPGDSLNRVHWKLSAKTGTLTIREPVEPQPGLLLLSLDLRGTAEELDRKLGRLLWLGNFLLSQEAAFEIRALTGEGVLTMPVSEEAVLTEAIDRLLLAPQAKDGSLRTPSPAAAWQYHIRGEADEGE